VPSWPKTIENVLYDYAKCLVPVGSGRSSALLFSSYWFCRLGLFANSWKGIVHDKPGHAVGEATVSLQATSGSRVYSANTSASGEFFFADIAAQSYRVAVKVNGKTWNAVAPLVIKDGGALAADLELSEHNQTLVVLALANPASPQGSGGAHLSSGEVSSLPLNERDFSKLLLLAAGTMTDTNGTANFTQQFTANGQRGVTSVFATDGADTSDPEMGGATFANFNVDAIQEVQSSSGVMPAEIGHGAAGFTNVITKSGASQMHGSAFELCAMRRLTPGIISITQATLIRGACLHSRATNLALPTAARW